MTNSAVGRTNAESVESFMPRRRSHQVAVNMNAQHFHLMLSLQSHLGITGLGQFVLMLSDRECMLRGTTIHELYQGGFYKLLTMRVKVSVMVVRLFGDSCFPCEISGDKIRAIIYRLDNDSLPGIHISVFVCFTIPVRS